MQIIKKRKKQANQIYYYICVSAVFHVFFMYALHLIYYAYIVAYCCTLSTNKIIIIIITEINSLQTVSWWLLTLIDIEGYTVHECRDRYHRTCSIKMENL